jgi:hypothetical protein
MSGHRVLADGGDKRPTAWWILGLSGDPTPGDPYMVGYESRRFDDLADEIDHARLGVVSLLQDKAIVGWLGASGDAFRAACEPCPGNLATLADAHRSAAKALSTWSTQLQGYQATADAAYWSAWHALNALNVTDESALRALAGIESDAAYQAQLDRLIPGLIPPDQPPLVTWQNDQIVPMVFPKPEQSADLKTLIDARATARRTAEDCLSAAQACRRALEAAAAELASITARRMIGGTDAVSFDERFAALHGNPADLVLSSADAAAFAGDVATAEFPPAGTSPSDVASWWTSLTPQEQQQLIADRPDLVGPLDGVSAVARDQANRKLLDAAIVALTASGSNPGLLNTLKNLKNKLNEGGAPLITGQDGNAPMTAPGDEQLLSPQMFLLGFSPDGQGRAVIAAGNPDTADNVVAYVPGMGTYLSDHFVSKDVLHAQNIAVAADQADPSHATSAIIWLGYDAPQVTGGAADWARELDITGTGDADTGAPAYQHFLTGLRATNTSGDLNLTALGHSYGSVLVGRASQLSGGLGVDNVVIVGSPGVGFDHASQFGIDPSRVWTAAAANDPVPKLNYATSASEMAIPIVGAYWSMLDDHKGGGWFGENPADAKFGANRFTVPIGGTGGLGMQAHGQYFDWSDSPARDSSLQQIARIVTNR